MNPPGKVTDNAFMESFFHSMKTEVIHGRVFDEDSQMLSALRSYIPFYTADECTRPWWLREDCIRNIYILWAEVA